MLTWIKRLRHRRRPEPEARGDRPVTPGQRAADAALDRAEAAHARLRAQRAEVREKAGFLERRRRENNFARVITETVLGGDSR